MMEFFVKLLTAIIYLRKNLQSEIAERVLNTPLIGYILGMIYVLYVFPLVGNVRELIDFFGKFHTLLRILTKPRLKIFVLLVRMYKRTLIRN